MNGLSALFDSSGGITYHWRALRYSQTLWNHHRENVRRFLEEWNPPRDSLLLIGPSAGYSLPADWLKQFKKITAVEPDPLARLLFERRLKIFPQWVSSTEASDSSVLYCNVLGQIPLDLKTVFKTKSWASFHDVLSGKQFRWKLSQGTQEKQSLENIKSGISASEGVSLLELNAHSAYDLFPASSECSFRYWEWRITPEQTQIIEGVYVLTHELN